MRFGAQEHAAAGDRRRGAARFAQRTAAQHFKCIGRGQGDDFAIGGDAVNAVGHAHRRTGIVAAHALAPVKLAELGVDARDDAPIAPQEHERAVGDQRGHVGALVRSIL